MADGAARRRGRLNTPFPTWLLCLRKVRSVTPRTPRRPSCSPQGVSGCRARRSSHKQPEEPSEDERRAFVVKPRVHDRTAVAASTLVFGLAARTCA
ncbi:hypothetical protein AOLI_G00221930 [Acnodon oligacanthus]